MGDFVLSKVNAIVAVNGRQFRLRENEPWAADDPVVQAFPSYFTRTPERVRRSEPVVEEATAAPGEKRRSRAR